MKKLVHFREPGSLFLGYINFYFQLREPRAELRDGVFVELKRTEWNPYFLITFDSEKKRYYLQISKNSLKSSSLTKKHEHQHQNNPS